MGFMRGGSSWNKKRIESWQARKALIRLSAFYRATMGATRSSGGSPTFAACVRPIPEIPTLVIHAYGCHVIRGKRDFLKAADLDNEAFAHNDLLEKSTVLEFHGGDLITDTRFCSSFQVIDASTRNWN